MLRFTLRRTGQMAVVVFGVVTLVFFLLRIASGDPAHMMNPPGQQEELVQLTREKLGTDRPLMVQYWDFLIGLPQGDLGTSFHGGHSVLDELLKALPNTAMLAVTTILFSSTVALILGIGSALYANKAFDRVVLLYVAVALATPGFCDHSYSDLLGEAGLAARHRHGRAQELCPTSNYPCRHAHPGAHPHYTPVLPRDTE